MRALMTAIVVAAVLGGCATTEPHSTYEAASVPASPAGEWRGTASEFQAPYIGTATATVTLNLNANGTWSETWTEGARTSSDSRPMERPRQHGRARVERTDAHAVDAAPRK